MATLEEFNLTLKTENNCESQDLQSLSLRFSNLGLDSNKPKTSETRDQDLDEFHNGEYKVWCIFKHVDASHLHDQNGILNCRGPSKKSSPWKKRSSPFPGISNRSSNFSDDCNSQFYHSIFLHYSGGGILTNTSSTNNTQNSFSYPQQTSSAHTINGGTSTGIPSPLEQQCESPSSQCSSTSGGDLISDLSSSPDNTWMVNSDFPSNTYVEKEKINQLKEMLAGPSHVKSLWEFERSHSPIDINECWNDIGEIIHRENYTNLPSQVISQNVLDTENKFVQNSTSKPVVHNFPIIIPIIVVKTSTDSKKKCPKILPKTTLSLHEESLQKKMVEYVHTATGTAKENLERSLDRNKKDNFVKIFLKENLNTSYFTKVDANNGRTNLHYAIMEKNMEKVYAHVEVSKQLINPKEKWIQEIDKPDKLSRTPLYYAAYYNMPSLVSYLLECGVNPLHKDEQGNTALHCAAEFGDSHNEVICTLGEFSMKVINVKNNKGFTPLNCAVNYYLKKLNYEGNFRIIKTLLNQRSSLSSQDTTGLTPLHWAVYAKNPKLVKLLCENAFDTRNAVDIQDIHGSTALHEAVSLDVSNEVKIKIIHILLSYNASLSIKDNKQQKPSDKINSTDVHLRSVFSEHDADSLT